MGEVGVGLGVGGNYQLFPPRSSICLKSEVDCFCRSHWNIQSDTATNLASI